MKLVQLIDINMGNIFNISHKFKHWILKPDPFQYSSLLPPM